MKKLFLLTALVLACTISKAQVPVDPDTKLITYQEVVNQEGSTKDSIYIRGIAWVNSYFKNPQGVTTIRDRENGIILGQHRVRMVDTDADGNVLNSNTIVEFTFKIEAKEGRYRYTINDFEMKATSRFPLERWLNKDDPQYTPKCDEYLAQVDTHIREMIADLKKGMEPKKVKVDEW
ncbi:MAG: hypothetical protein CVU11_04140 [Bacteroidetes bacterium HGW-Bacteroidetes-6]|jgi:hypothetical protein|nr:MAG: hypothetical protein CVU11_04140 [Bacteroidetes bacterium HGW-Bacteroidetes-6]